MNSLEMFLLGISQPVLGVSLFGILGVVIAGLWIYEKIALKKVIRYREQRKKEQAR